MNPEMILAVTGWAIALYAVGLWRGAEARILLLERLTGTGPPQAGRPVTVKRQVPEETTALQRAEGEALAQEIMAMAAEEGASVSPDAARKEAARLLAQVETWAP